MMSQPSSNNDTAGKPASREASTSHIEPPSLVLDLGALCGLGRPIKPTKAVLRGIELAKQAKSFDLAAEAQKLVWQYEAAHPTYLGLDQHGCYTSDAAAAADGLMERVLQHHDAAVKPRARIEYRIVALMLQTLLDAGYELTIDAESDQPEKFTTLEAALTLIFNLDECVIDANKGEVRSFVSLVMGNDGWDVIHDHGGSLTKVLEPVTDLANQLGGN